MIGLAGDRAHSLRTDVQQVRGLGRRVSDALADPAAAVDQERFDTATCQLRGEDRPRRATADDCDRRLAVRFRSQANSPDSQRRLCACSYGRTCG
jgi:hypothetical protein